MIIELYDIVKIDIIIKLLNIDIINTIIELYDILK